MSKLIKRNDFTDMVELWFTDDEKIGTFQNLECEIHGLGICFTDKSGADNCIECIKDKFAPAITYPIPGFENLDESLAKLTIRKSPHQPQRGGTR